mgnify:CR=1 FL=1
MSREESFLKLLKAQCKSCTKGTLKVYHSSIKRLHRLLNPDATSVPTTKAWLMSEKLFEKYKMKPVNIRRHLAMGAYKATQAYHIKPENKWYAAMVQSQAKYQEQRNKNEPSEKEKDLIPKAGMKAIKRSAVELKKRLKFVFADKPSKAGVFKIQMWLALKLYTKIPFRNDLPTIHVKEKKENHLVKAKNGYKIVMVKYKNSDRLGPREIKVSRAGSMALTKFLRIRDKVIEHDMLFSNKNGKPMSKSAFGKALQNTTEKLLGKRIGSRIIRIVFSSEPEHKAVIEKAAEITNKLLHTAKQTKQYIRK